MIYLSMSVASLSASPVTQGLALLTNDGKSAIDSYFKLNNTAVLTGGYEILFTQLTNVNPLDTPAVLNLSNQFSYTRIGGVCRIFGEFSVGAAAAAATTIQITFGNFIKSTNFNATADYLVDEFTVTGVGAVADASATVVNASKTVQLQYTPTDLTVGRLHYALSFRY